MRIIVPCLLVAFCLLLWPQLSSAVLVLEPVFDADFNDQPLGPLAVQSTSDPLPWELPTMVIRDTGCTVDVVASPGDLTTNAVVLDSVPGGLASAAFYNPGPFDGGFWVLSWDSLVLETPTRPEAEQSNVSIVRSSLSDLWGLKYQADGTFAVKDATGIHSHGYFTVGEKDHFDLFLDLNANTYNLWINGGNPFSGEVDALGDFSHTYFRSNGREFGQDPARLAFDNVSVIGIPEPLSLSILTLGCLVFLMRRRR